MFGMDAETYFMKLNIYLCLSLAVIGFWAAMSDFPYTHEGLDTYLSFFQKYLQHCPPLSIGGELPQCFCYFFFSKSHNAE